MTDRQAYNPFHHLLVRDSNLGLKETSNRKQQVRLGSKTRYVEEMSSFAFIHIVQSYNMIHSAKLYRRARIYYYVGI